MVGIKRGVEGPEVEAVKTGMEEELSR